jgi:hypothetical protein
MDEYHYPINEITEFVEPRCERVGGIDRVVKW